MEYKEIIINLPENLIEEVSAILTASDLGGFVIEDPREFKNFVERETAYWDYIENSLVEEKEKSSRIKFYTAKNEQGEEQSKRIIALIEKYADSIKFSSVREEDFANSWKKYYKPFAVGKRLYVVPEWEEPGDTEGRIIFKCNPGMAFGSGSHATTKLCMQQLEKRVNNGARIYDLGCGSGILAIIAKLLGAGEVKGIDVDKNAADVAAQNAELNGVSCDFIAGDVIKDKILLHRLCAEKADIVVANIVADVIIAILPSVKEILKDGGVFIASGIIGMRALEVENALCSGGFEIVEKQEMEDWVCLVSKFAK